MAPTSRQDRRRQRDGEGDYAAPDDTAGRRDGSEATDAVLWLELARGTIADALAERLAQAHMRHVPPSSNASKRAPRRDD